MTLTIHAQLLLKKKPDPKLVNQIKNSTVSEIKLKVNTHTQEDSLEL